MFSRRHAAIGDPYLSNRVRDARLLLLIAFTAWGIGLLCALGGVH